MSLNRTSGPAPKLSLLCTSSTELRLLFRHSRFVTAGSALDAPARACRAVFAEGASVSSRAWNRAGNANKSARKLSDADFINAKKFVRLFSRYRQKIVSVFFVMITHFARLYKFHWP